MPAIAETVFLYRVWARRGELLYIGISESPLRRWGKHSQDQPWWPQVHRLEAVAVGTRQEAEIAEYVAIGLERPRYNFLPRKAPPGAEEAFRAAARKRPSPTKDETV